ncbi:modification methylase [Azorhizobium caulinodans ORS 571]|uniref:Release factor glutamine methyltransferase n=1 Tax=Azorhizobium caulinodans (strain ATCC 43989 / DSM 5975 / JCM 20966 / LMG 6465 / NBRC 14845 / NCIMB 13405 / ORS 571) TaxID=438753 RepID=A8HYS0_AZOC5|nr:peptide chain release factor N(5)-glutamine methyltransferase [Azorhizobium caulinodans]BAF90491.1 modification methylase [Azorhizobium caulinodans ORS 571]
MTAPPLTLGGLRRQLATRFSAAGIDSPDLDASLLIAHALGLEPGDVRLRGADPLAPDALPRIEALAAQRLSGVPVARLVGEKEFWSLSFSLSPETLVPRPDTETVVEAALMTVTDRTAPLHILDLGTGSGAILAALLVELPAAVGIGVDQSEGAARTARDNLARAGLQGRGTVIVGDWASALGGGFDLVVSNPPYIPSIDIVGLAIEVRENDPLAALDGGADGLSSYRIIAAEAPRLLKAGGHLVLELGIGQEAEVAALAGAAGLAITGPARRDLGGIPRALVARRS